jgi:hypothetical protein
MSSGSEYRQGVDRKSGPARHRNGRRGRQELLPVRSSGGLGNRLEIVIVQDVDPRCGDGERVNRKMDALDE